MSIPEFMLFSRLISLLRGQLHSLAQVLVVQVAPSYLVTDEPSHLFVEFATKKLWC